MVPMNATRPMRPTTKRNDVSVIITSSYFFVLDFLIKYKPNTKNSNTTPNPEKNKELNSIPCCMIPARMTPPNTSFAMSRQNLPASKETL